MNLNNKETKMHNFKRLTITEEGVTDDYYRASEVDTAMSESITKLEKVLNYFADKRISVLDMEQISSDRERIKKIATKWVNRIYGLLVAINTLGYKITFDYNKSSLPEYIQALAGRNFLIATYGYNFKIVKEENTQN